MNKVRLESFAAEGLDEQIDVAAGVYSTPEVTSKCHLRWKHLEGSGGASTSVSARDAEGVLVGRSFLQPRQMYLGPALACQAATVTDLVVRPEQRSAATMIAMTRAIRAPEGVDIVFHTSNEISDVFYRKLFKFPIAFSLKAVGLPLGLTGALRRVGFSDALARLTNLFASPWRLTLLSFAGGGTLATGLDFGPEPEAAVKAEVLARFREYAGPHLERNESFLDWRFFRGPLFKASIRWLWLDGDCIGYLALRPLQINGLKIMVIMDSVIDRSLSRGQAATLKLRVAHLASIEKCDAVFTIANLTNRALAWLKGFPFVSIPDRYLPHPTPIFIHAGADVRERVDRNDLFFTLADLDYF